MKFQSVKLIETVVLVEFARTGIDIYGNGWSLKPKFTKHPPALQYN
jgi:hypothetical protein